MTEIVLRFVQSKSWSSKLIVAFEKTAMPFPPSHVEAETPDGFWLGAHQDGGVEERDKGYDYADVAVDPKTGRRREFFLTLPATADQHDAFYGFLRSRIGEPYDWKAILGFALPFGHEHTPFEAICSAVIALGLRASPAPWFPFRLAVPAHLIDPPDLLLMLSTRVEIPL